MKRVRALQSLIDEKKKAKKEGVKKPERKVVEKVKPKPKFDPNSFAAIIGRKQEVITQEEKKETKLNLDYSYRPPIFLSCSLPEASFDCWVLNNEDTLQQAYDLIYESYDEELYENFCYFLYNRSEKKYDL